MEEFRQWAVCIIIAAAAGTIVTFISPRGAMNKTVSAVAGVFVVTAICTPLTEIKKADFLLGDASFSESEEIYSFETEKNLTQLCRNAIADRVTELVNEAGGEVTGIEAEISLDENGCIIIHEVLVEVANCDSTQMLAEMLFQKLGVHCEVRNGISE